MSDSKNNKFDIETIYEAITQLIGDVVIYAGSMAAFSYAIFVFLGKKWIEAKFARDIEKYKSEQEVELEKLKLNINTLFNKVLKIQDREYDILPTLWGKLHILKLAVSNTITLFKQIPKLNSYSNEDLKKFIHNNNIPNDIAEKLYRESDKQKYYSLYLDALQMKVALNAFSEFSEYFEVNKIFLSSEIKEKTSLIHKYLRSVWVDRNMSLNYDIREFWNSAYNTMENKVQPLAEEIEELVQKHLYNFKI